MTKPIVPARGLCHPGRRVRGTTALSAAVSAILMQAGAAQAADPASNNGEIEELVVTGIRYSIQSSIEVKMDSTSIVESITAEDIGKLPDISIAESIARLPGITAQRVGGRAQVISIRGMSPDFAVTLLNGRELVSTAENRGIEYDQYPSELINGVTVYKTPDATLTAQGVSGTVDLHTLRPLEQAESTVVLNARLERNGNGELNDGVSEMGNRASATYVGQFADRTVGLALTYAHLDSPTQAKRFNAWWWDAGVLDPPNDDAIGLMGGEFWADSSAQKRDGLMGVLEFKPNDNYHSIVDLYYSKFDQEDTLRGLIWESGGTAWGDSTVFNNPTIEDLQGGLRMVTAATLSGIFPVLQSNYNTRTDKLFNAGWRNEVQAGDWGLVADLSYSNAKSDIRTIETTAGLGDYGSLFDNNFAYSSPVGVGMPRVTPGYNYADASLIKLSDPGAWGQDGFERNPQVDDTLWSVRLSGKRSLSAFFKDVEFGVNYSDRDKQHEDHDYQYFLKNTGTPILVPSNLLLHPTSLRWGGIKGILAYNVPRALRELYDTPLEEDTTQPYIWRRNYEIQEKITTGYGMLSIDTDWGSVPVKGNLGVQYVHTQQHSYGVKNMDRRDPIDDGASFNDFLPSLNLAFNFSGLMDDFWMRVGIARTLSRPRMEDLKAGISAGVSETPPYEWSGSGGNPKLKPWKADSYDLSFEKYFDRKSYVAIAGFYKDLKTYIYSQPMEYDFTGFPNTTGHDPESPIGILDAPQNGQGGSVYGAEFSFALDGGQLWHYLEGFGVTGSVSDTKSSIKPNGPGTNDKLPGLSDVVSNMVVYYENHGFAARVARRYRSAFRAESLGPHGDRISTEIKAESIIDFETEYEFQDGWGKGLSVIFQINNLNDSPYRTRYVRGVVGKFDAPESKVTYGQQYLLGLNYKF